MMLLGDIVDDCLDHDCMIEVWNDKDGLHIIVSDKEVFSV